MTGSVAAVLVLSAGLTFAQADHEAMVHRGDREMGFSHEKTTHHFELNYDGGVIDARADDARDKASREQIQSHFQHIVQMFASGNFNTPMLIHGKNVPGTAAMTAMKDQIHWNLEQTPRGARINIVADTKPARDAVHDFLRFQIDDHKTGDCKQVR